MLLRLSSGERRSGTARGWQCRCELLVANGADNEPMPVTGLAANFSPIPRTAPPPLGREIGGAAEDSPPTSPDAVLTRDPDEESVASDIRSIPLKPRK